MTSVYALEFILKSDILTADERSGDSISHIYIDSPDNGSGPDGGTEPVQELTSIPGEHTLTTFPFYLIDNTNSLFVGFLEQQFWMRKFKVFGIKIYNL